jgi:hypothetical protein
LTDGYHAEEIADVAAVVAGVVETDCLQLFSQTVLADTR